MRTGVDRHTGQVLTGWDHCRQSISTILSTRIGALVMARDFGSKVPGLVDRPSTRKTLVDVYMATVQAVRREEPGFRITGMSVAKLDAAGAPEFTITGVFYPNALEGDFKTTQPVTAGFSMSAAILKLFGGRTR